MTELASTKPTLEFARKPNLQQTAVGRSSFSFFVLVYGCIYLTFRCSGCDFDCYYLDFDLFGCDIAFSGRARGLFDLDFALFNRAKALYDCAKALFDVDKGCFDYRFLNFIFEIALYCGESESRIVNK